MQFTGLDALPLPGSLLPEADSKPPAKGQHHGQHMLRYRDSMGAFSVGQDGVCCLNFREQQLFNSGA